VSAIDKSTHDEGAYLAPQPEITKIIGILSDICTALEGIGLELEKLRHALEPLSPPVQGEEPAATYTPIYTRRGTMTSPEWESWVGGSR
jgi:hypothetical protein